MVELKYKIGDKVRIKSIDWYNENKDKFGCVDVARYLFVPLMSQFCGKVVTIKEVVTHDYDDYDDFYVYHMEEIGHNWTDEFIECKVEEETKPKFKVGDRVKWYNHTCDITSIDTSENTYKYLISNFDYGEDKVFAKWIPESELTFDGDEETSIKLTDKAIENNEMVVSVSEYILPEGYIFKDENGNVINATKIVLEKKKKSMIREEQIDNAAQEYIDSDNAVLTYSDGFCEQTDHPFVRAAFKAGAEWADNDVTQDDCSKAPKLTSEDYSNGRFGYRLPAGFKAKLTERELILTPETPKYPKSLLDCENVLNGVRNDRKKLLHKFNELLICRDAYWKIAGEEMGLGKPWEPDWNDADQNRYVIAYFCGNIEKSRWDYGYSTILTFPTAEMRDAFYENFKKEIEICKELL